MLVAATLRYALALHRCRADIANGASFDGALQMLLRQVYGFSRKTEVSNQLRQISLSALEQMISALFDIVRKTRQNNSLGEQRTIRLFLSLSSIDKKDKIGFQKRHHDFKCKGSPAATKVTLSQACAKAWFSRPCASRNERPNCVSGTNPKPISFETKITGPSKLETASESRNVSAGKSNFSNARLDNHNVRQSTTTIRSRRACVIKTSTSRIRSSASSHSGPRSFLCRAILSLIS